jgi:hypothetical protein
MAGGVEIDNSCASHAALGERLWFGDIMPKHKSGEQHFSDPHQVICIGNLSPEAARRRALPQSLYYMEHSQYQSGTRVGMPQHSVR